MAKETYAGKMRAAMREHGISLRDIEAKTDYSYEHLRKIRAGRSVLSKEVSDAICEILKLDPRAMWEIAKVEKLQSRYGQVPAALVPAADDRMKRYWSLLTRDEQNEVVALVEAMAKKHLAMQQPDNEQELIHIIATASAKLGNMRSAQPVTKRAASK